MKSCISKLSIVPVMLASLALATTLAGCFGGGGQAKKDVDQARDIIGGSQELVDDLSDLDARFNTLGTRFSKVEDTIAEGKSLAQMAMIDVDELDARYTQARDLLTGVIQMEDAGNYADYSKLALQAVQNKMDAIANNRDLLTAVSDMLDVLPMAQNEDQLSYYVQRIDQLSRNISDLDARAADAAAAADEYFKENKL
jgi:hypothetical protein